MGRDFSSLPHRSVSDFSIRSSLWGGAIYRSGLRPTAFSARGNRCLRPAVLQYPRRPPRPGRRPTIPSVPAYEPGSSNNTAAAENTIWKFWYTSSNGAGHYLTGDNCREKPYSDLYPRVTTKSNTYTVHVRVQTLRQTAGPTGDLTKWHEGKDEVVGEYRGAITIERYIDPDDPLLTSYVGLNGAAFGTKSLEPLYRFRIVNTKKFAP